MEDPIDPYEQIELLQQQLAEKDAIIAPLRQKVAELEGRLVPRQRPSQATAT